MGVIGLGYVGLPLSLEMAGSGLEVLGFEIDSDKVNGINEGQSHVIDVSDQELDEVLDTGRFRATCEMHRISECDAISICVPTPLSKSHEPDISYILSASKMVSESLRKGQLIVLESTSYPGTTREAVLPVLEQTGLEIGKDFFLCFSPERVDPGNKNWDIKNTPKVIGGITKDCLLAGRAVYERFVDDLVPVSSTEAAELVKILENTFRAVNIAMVNEIALIADRLAVDIWEVVDAASTKPFGFMRFTPGPGFGGHCIPVDPQYLAWKMRGLNYRTRFVELASELNAEMPKFLVEKVRSSLESRGETLEGANIMIIGVSYKKDVGDVRESPALHVIQELLSSDAKVEYHDPYVPELQLSEGLSLSSVTLTDEILSQSDAVVIVTDHSSLDYSRILDSSSILVDARNATRFLSRD
ncbi:MAG: nucleotide sugar dehydrogenase, partial [bacterium]